MQIVRQILAYFFGVELRRERGFDHFGEERELFLGNRLDTSELTFVVSTKACDGELHTRVHMVEYRDNYDEVIWAMPLGHDEPRPCDGSCQGTFHEIGGSLITI